MECAFLAREDLHHPHQSVKTFQTIFTFKKQYHQSRQVGGCQGVRNAPLSCHMVVIIIFNIGGNTAKGFDRLLQIMHLLSLLDEQLCYQLSHPQTKAAYFFQSFIGVQIKLVKIQ